MSMSPRQRLALSASVAFAGVMSVAGIVHTANAPQTPTPPVDSTIWAAYKWRNVGPPRGGRSIAVSGVRGRPKEAYFGAVGGGLWKTIDNGQNWMPVTDDQITSASVGAVAVSESNPDIVFIGTGESCIRGNIMPGDGVYKSTDAGKTWKHVGFKNSDAISKIRIHPTNPNIVFVADFGKYSVPSEERGVYKSTDGGSTWRKVLDRGPNTGAVDIEIDQTNPNIMYAAMWEAYRKEYQMSSGGPGSGLFKSTDGGEHWTEITRNPGMPSGLVGKIGIALTAANPNRVYALIENEPDGGLYRSEDGGAHWAFISGDHEIRQRAFYFTHIAGDPKNADVLYALNVSFYKSTDGGKTITAIRGSHSDNHDLWVDPDNTEHLVLGNDGGGAVSADGGKNWSAEDYSTAQLYHVVATANVPYDLCGAQQDDGTICVHAAPATAGGRGGRGGPPPAQTMADTYGAGGSEDGYIATDPTNPDVFYSGGNNGSFLIRLNRRTGEQREVNPYPREFSGEESAILKERWQWTYPIIFSPVNPKILYTGSQHLWSTTNGGQSWTQLSPDLTRHDPKTMGVSGGPITHDMNGPEVYGVIFAIGPSKRTTNVIWTGSDDGLIYVTKNAGKAWTNVTPKSMPDFGRVSIIDASAFDSASAYAAVKRPLLDDQSPYIFRTHDFGKTWTKIVNGIAPNDYVHSVREDPKRRGLLYAAAQHGMYISYDDGDHWESLSLNLPDVPVHDIEVEDHDIAIATHGRGFYVLDNIEPLRQYKPAMAAEHDVVLFTPPTVVRSGPPATVQYWLKHPVNNIRIDILDAKGQLVRSLPDTGNAGGRGGGGGRGGNGPQGPAKTAGLHSFTWDGRYASAVTFPGMILWGATTNGPLAAPGKYTVRFTADGKAVTAPLVIQRHPLHEATDADLAAQTALALQIRDKVSEANSAVIQIRDLKKQIADRMAKSSDATLKTSGDQLTASLSGVEEDVYQVRNSAGEDPLNFPIKTNNRLASLLRVVTSGEGRPITNANPIFTDLKGELKVEMDRLQKILNVDVPTFNALLERLGLAPVVVGKPVVF
jgi:photosystem II stability/assembly factor-like uncharacterized protein